LSLLGELAFGVIGDQKHCFSLKTADGKLVKLSAESAEEREHWVNVLRALVPLSKVEKAKERLVYLARVRAEHEHVQKHCQACIESINSAAERLLSSSSFEAHSERLRAACAELSMHLSRVAEGSVTHALKVGYAIDQVVDAANSAVAICGQRLFANKIQQSVKEVALETARLLDELSEVHQRVTSAGTGTMAAATKHSSSAAAAAAAASSSNASGGGKKASDSSSSWQLEDLELGDNVRRALAETYGVIKVKLDQLVDELGQVQSKDDKYSAAQERVRDAVSRVKQIVPSAAGSSSSAAEGSDDSQAAAAAASSADDGAQLLATGHHLATRTKTLLDGVHQLTSSIRRTGLDRICDDAVALADDAIGVLDGIGGYVLPQAESTKGHLSRLQSFSARLGASIVSLLELLKQCSTNVKRDKAFRSRITVASKTVESAVNDVLGAIDELQKLQERRIRRNRRSVKKHRAAGAAASSSKKARHHKHHHHASSSARSGGSSKEDGAAKPDDEQERQDDDDDDEQKRSDDEQQEQEQQDSGNGKRDQHGDGDDDEKKETSDASDAEQKEDDKETSDSSDAEQKENDDDKETCDSSDGGESLSSSALDRTESRAEKEFEEAAASTAAAADRLNELLPDDAASTANGGDDASASLTSSDAATSGQDDASSDGKNGAAVSSSSSTTTLAKGDTGAAAASDDEVDKATTLVISVDANDLRKSVIIAAKHIASATSKLMRAAAATQREIAQLYKQEADARGGADAAVDAEADAWTEGLIGAAQAVAATTQQLVAVATDDFDQGALIAASRGISAATARLVSATKVKSRSDSRALFTLNHHAVVISSACNQLMDGLKELDESDSESSDSDDDHSDDELIVQAPAKTLEFIKAEFEAQKKIAMLERALEQARKDLFRLRKQASFSQRGK
jgi:I/LWEQ domain